MAHTQGGSAIDTLLDVFERLDREKPLAPTRSHILHGSMQSAESVARMKRLGILADVQAGWLYYDVPALERVFGPPNLRENTKGSLEPGKLADLVVIDRDFLACDLEDLRRIDPFLTLVEGQAVYDAGKLAVVPPVRP